MISNIEFEHGEYTCASEPGKFCRFVSPKPNTFGQTYLCRLYSVYILDTDGWLKRCSECLEENE